MESKIYTAQELREQAIRCELDYDDSFATAAMLRQAADIQERCEKVIAKCNAAKDMNIPTWNFDKQAFALDLYEVVNYILRGDAGKEEK